MVVKKAKIQRRGVASPSGPDIVTTLAFLGARRWLSVQRHINRGGALSEPLGHTLRQGLTRERLTCHNSYLPKEDTRCTHCTGDHYCSDEYQFGTLQVSPFFRTPWFECLKGVIFVDSVDS